MGKNVLCKQKQGRFCILQYVKKRIKQESEGKPNVWSCNHLGLGVIENTSADFIHHSLIELPC